MSLSSGLVGFSCLSGIDFTLLIICVDYGCKIQFFALCVAIPCVSRYNIYENFILTEGACVSRLRGYVVPYRPPTPDPDNAGVGSVNSLLRLLVKSPLKHPARGDLLFIA